MDGRGIIATDLVYLGVVMTVVEEKELGRFSVEVELANHEDLFRAKAGLIPAEKVRRALIRVSGERLIVVRACSV